MMTKKMMAIGTIALGLLTIISCGSDDDGGAPPPAERADFRLELSNLEPLEGNFIYEGWIIVNGAPISTGTFDGTEDEYTFNTVKSDLDSATRFVISIEPVPDTDPAPADTKILGGDFTNERANLNLDQIADFSAISGNFEIFTPSDTDDTNEENGIWFINRKDMPEMGEDPLEAGLELPNFTAESGWKYEGWVIINDIPVSTGTFTDVASFDDSSPFSGNNPQVPVFPGEDFLSSTFTSGMTTLTFPADGDITGKNVVISIEPNPDNDPAPFFIKPLVGTAGSQTSPATNGLSRNAISLNIIGSVTR